MDHKINNLVDESGRIRTAPAAAPARTEPPRPGVESFDALMKQVVQDVEALQGETRKDLGRLSAEPIREPEELDAAVREAGEKFQSCMKLGKNLIKAYEATVKNRVEA
jgi:hypothetical protein